MWYCLSTSLLKSSPPLGWDCQKNSKTDGKNKETEKKKKVISAEEYTMQKFQAKV